MRKIKSENGITMMVLVVTIIVLSIIASIVIQYSINGGEYSKEKQLLSDLEIVQHAVYEQYEQYRTTGDESFIVGSKANNPNDGRITWEDNNAYWSTSERDKQYYVLTPEDLKQLGIDNSKNTYIVNYYTGECYNSTVRTTPENNKVLYKK